jgi:putative transposase
MDKAWPHAPTHLLIEAGVYMLTAATYEKEHFFRGGARLSMLEERFLGTSERFGWTPMAWAFFSNHYHVVMLSPEDPATLSEVLRRVHGSTSLDVNRLDGVRGRKVWFQFRDRRLTFEKSYHARLKYVITNPVKHGLVREPAQYRWCSAAWFARNAPPSFCRTILDLPCDQVVEPDEFDPE